MWTKKLTKEGTVGVIDYQSFLNREVQQVKPSGIRRFFDIASEMDNVISLSIGEPDFSTPYHVRQEGIRTLEKGKTWYSPNRGFMELREEISSWMNRKYGVTYEPKTDVLVTVGGSEALDMCIRSLINPGDEVLIPEPSFVCYVPMTQMAKGVPVVIETKAENHFRLTAEELRSKITDKTKLLILPFPNNPTGAVMRREHLEAIAEVVREHNLLVLSDEIYGELTYGKEKHVRLDGTINIGSNCYIGASCILLPGICIGDNITLGAGTTCSKSVTEQGVYVSSKLQYIPYDADERIKSLGKPMAIIDGVERYKKE